MLPARPGRQQTPIAYGGSENQAGFEREDATVPTEAFLVKS